MAKDTYEPIEIRRDDYSVSLNGDLLITGKSAERLRLCIVNHPQFYPKYVVPFIRKMEKTFQPNEFWIDPIGRIHITNTSLVVRMRRHIPSKRQRTRVVGRK